LLEVFRQPLLHSHHCTSDRNTTPISKQCKFCARELHKLYASSSDYNFGSLSFIVAGWPSGFAFILSFMAPLYSIGQTFFLLPNCQFMTTFNPSGGYDASVHMSEEASNAATAIPLAIVSNTRKCLILVLTQGRSVLLLCRLSLVGVCGTTCHTLILITFSSPGINVSLAFCMGTDLENVLNSPIGQPMAQILYNSLGQRGALALWCLIISTLYVFSGTWHTHSLMTEQVYCDIELPLSRLSPDICICS